VESGDLAFTKLTTDPGGVVITQDDAAVLVDDLNDAAGRKVMHRERSLKMLDLDAGADDARQPPGRIFDAARDRGHPIAGGAAAHRIADGDALPVRQDPGEIIAIADKGAAAFGLLERRADVLAVERGHQKVADIVGQLGLGLPQYRVVGFGAVRFDRYGLARAFPEKAESGIPIPARI
jgi:hypothetical protein